MKLLSNKGQALIEYVLIISLISVVAISVVKIFGGNMKINVKLLDIDIIECQTLYKRAMGFMFQRKKITSGLLFKNCNAIHTFFMYQPIDVIMTDVDNNILFSYQNLKPGKIILPKKDVYCTYELPVGSINKIESN